MALTDFVGGNQGLRDVIRDMSTDRMNTVLQKFVLRENDVNLIRAFYDGRTNAILPSDIQAIENVRTLNQSVVINLYQNRAPGTGTQRVRDSADGQSVFNFTPTYFDPIVEGFAVSVSNNAVRQFMNEGASAPDAIRMAFENEYMFGLAMNVKNIYRRANLQFLNFLETNKWPLNTTADAGTIYTNYVGDAKRVPFAEQTEFVQNAQIEQTQNNFTILDPSAPKFIHSPAFMRVINNYLKSGPQNAQDLQRFLGWFDAYTANDIVDSGVSATGYMVAPGGIFGYSRAFDYARADPDSQNGVSRHGEDSWTTMTMGGDDTMFFRGAPQITIEVKMRGGYADNFATIGVDEARIDIQKSFVTTATFGAGKVPVPAGNDDSPILKYEIEAAP